MWESLEGKKTNICAVLALFIVGCHGMGWITDEQKTVLLEIFGAGGLLALRSAIAHKPPIS